MKSEIRPQDIATMLHIRPRDAHKGTMGHALLVAGSHGMAGCAMLAAESCLRSGAGKVTVWTAEANRIPLHCAVPEAILCLRETCDATGFQALGIGPGMGLGEEAAHRLHCLLAQSKAPLVLDADALTICGRTPGLLSSCPSPLILTPHEGEFRRLGGDLSGGRLAGALSFCAKHEVILILKGYGTLVCRGGEVSVNPTGSPAMAKGGSGDVLCGILCALLAQGFDPLFSSRCAVFLHGLAGDLARDALGEYCVTPSDLIRFLPGAFRQLTVS